MKPSLPLLVAMAKLVLFAPSAATSGEMKQEVKADGANPQLLRTMFGTYGHRAKECILREADGFRIRLPAGGGGVRHSGVYSYFALAGDWDVVVTYELLSVQPPRKGHGSAVGLAVDNGSGRGSIQRGYNSAGKCGYLLRANSTDRGKQTNEKHGFVPCSCKRGQMGLRRVHNELIFLASDDPSGPLVELERSPFSDRTIRTVCFFADAGGSPTSVDVRVKGIHVRAEEITAGLPRLEPGTGNWLWLLAIVPASALGVLYWRRRMQQA